MTQTNIATLKAKLSYFLYRVRRGEEILVLDRQTPIAKVIPSQEVDDFKIIEAPSSPALLKSLKYTPLGNKRIDSVRLLEQDRNRR